MSSFAISVALTAAGVVTALILAGFLARRWKRLSAIERVIERRDNKAERTRFRLDLLSIRTNILALTLISAVGLLQVGLEIWRMNAPEPSSAALEELLRSKLPDLEVQRLRHQQLIEALHGTRPNDPRSEPDDQLRATLSDLQTRVVRLETARPVVVEDIAANTTGSWLASFVTSIAFFALFFVLFWVVVRVLNKKELLSDGDYRRVTRSAAVISTIGSLAGGVTLFKDFSLIKSIESLIKVEVGRGSGSAPTSKPQSAEIKLDLNLSLANLPFVKMDCGDDKGSRRIRPFEKGTKELVDDGLKKLNDVAESVTADVRTGRVIAIMLIGSADRRSLKVTTAKEFNSNQGLAAARVTVVRDKLVTEFQAANIEKPPITESYAGPTKTQADSPIAELDVDREVRVCVLLNSEKPATPLQATPSRSPPSSSVDAAPSK